MENVFTQIIRAHTHATIVKIIIHIIEHGFNGINYHPYYIHIYLFSHIYVYLYIIYSYCRIILPNFIIKLTRFVFDVLHENCLFFKFDEF